MRLPNQIVTIYVDLQCDKNITTETLAKRVGGPDAYQVKANSKPWMVSFLPYLNCSGALITKRVVLTAAHCVTKFHINGDEHVMVGEHDTKKKEFGDQFIRVKSAKQHENFTGIRALARHILGCFCFTQRGYHCMLDTFFSILV